jgi:hypothetical protein
MGRPHISLRFFFLSVALACALFAWIAALVREQRRVQAEKTNSEIMDLEHERAFLIREQNPSEPRSKRLKEVEASINEKLQQTGVAPYPSTK